MTLKINLLPLIMQEVDILTGKYITILNDLREKNSDKLNNDFKEIRESV